MCGCVITLRMLSVCGPLTIGEKLGFFELRNPRLPYRGFWIGLPISHDSRRPRFETYGVFFPITAPRHPPSVGSGATQRDGYSVIRDSAVFCQTQISAHMSEPAGVPNNSRARRLSS